VVVIAKHLCGVASDLAIRSTQDPALRQGGGGGGAKDRKIGVCVATCCHHACSWADYTGKRWLQEEAGFTKEEFNLLKHWSGWCTGLQALWSGVDSARRGSTAKAESDSVGPSEKRRRVEEQGEGGDEGKGALEIEERNEHGPVPKGDFPRPTGISSEAMAKVGFLTKRVLDQGRCQALKEMGLQAKQVQYCTPHESPECYVIVAWLAE